MSDYIISVRDAAIAALELVLDKQRLLTQDEANKLGIEWDANKELTVQQAYDNLLAKQAKLEEPTVLTAQLSVDYINTQIAELEAKIDKIKHDSTISPEMKKAKIHKTLKRILLYVRKLKL